MIDNLLEEEVSYFSPILNRSSKYSKEELLVFAKETVRERKKRVSLEVYDLFNGQVKYGPFKDLKLNNNVWWGILDLGSMCLGEYEKDVLFELVNCASIYKKKVFIDIGAADGYYAIGMLFAGLVEKSICYELTSEGRQCIVENWKNNGSMGELEVYGDVFEDFDFSLNKFNFKDSMILIDIEGFEFEFLTKNRLSIISKAILFIEIHHWIPNFLEKYKKLLLCCDEYFQISILKSSQKLTDSFSELRDFTDDNRFLLFSESRPGQMRFLKLVPK